jgi:hypothetical protein
MMNIPAAKLHCAFHRAACCCHPQRIDKHAALSCFEVHHICSSKSQASNQAWVKFWGRVDSAAESHLAQQAAVRYPVDEGTPIACACPQQ